MFSHLTLGYNDRAESEAFYGAILPDLGLPRRLSGEHFFGFGLETDPAPRLFVVSPFDGNQATCGNGFHIALVAASPEAVERFHRQALAAGGRDDGPPGLRLHYTADYYAAYIRDPVGNKVQAVCYLHGRKAHQTGAILSHVTIGANDVETAGRFYESLFAELGYDRLRDEESPGEDFCFGYAGFQLPVAFVQRTFDGAAAQPGNGQHAAFLAETRAAVDRFHAAALRLGGADAGAPGLRPHYHASYYAAYIRDLDGNKIQAVCHAAP